ncbi:MAG: heme o synthase, partial [Pseudomonadota bacterium]|nr:heme o synthase [Pseudomonadota bacterium]
MNAAVLQAAASTGAAQISGVGRAPAATWRDYLALLKPRVMSLVVFTGLTGLVCAGQAVHPVTAAVAVLCIAVGAGAAGALNMAYDADIDAVMRRTRGRPVAAGRIQASEAYGFGVALSLFSVLLMTLAANLLAAGLLAFTIVFYALVYTVWLKRSTPQNIVIGGAAGALPPVIGWAAATGTAPAEAWLLFALIFVWTPPHFWALSLYASEDYARAKVPMLPVIKGPAETRRQILLYSLVLAPLGIAPALIGLGGWAYAVAGVAGGALFLLLAWRVFRSRAGEADAHGGLDLGDGLYDAKFEAKPARDLFAFSILYLFGLFAVLLAER